MVYNHFWHIQDGLDNTNFLGFKPGTHHWLVKDHTSSPCTNLDIGEFRMGKSLVDLTLEMLRDKENAQTELMNTSLERFKALLLRSLCASKQATQCAFNKRAKSWQYFLGHQGDFFIIWLLAPSNPWGTPGP